MLPTAQLERAHELFAQWEAELARELPAGAPAFDAHTHLGNDIDGMHGDLEQLLAINDAHGVVGAFVFCLDEPDRVPAFRAANDRTLAYAARSGGRLVPFVRLDLSDSPIEEATRCLDLGARGIKLHPRAQAFAVGDDRLGPVFALAEERRVPILIHGGRGLPPIADDLHRLVVRHPGATLIIAHAGIADLAGLAGAFSGNPSVFFDTSVWSTLDLLDFFRQVSPEQVVYASDYPYGAQPDSLLLALRTARASGYTEQQVRDMLAGNALRIRDGLPPLPTTVPRGSAEVTQHLVLARVHNYIAMAMPLLWTRQLDQLGALGLALNTCEETGASELDLSRIHELLAAGRDLWRTLPDAEDEGEQRVIVRTTFKLLHLADIVALTA